MDGILLESFPINIGPSCAAGTAGVVEGVSSAVHCNAVLGFYYPCDSHENQPPLVGVHHLILCLCLHWIKPLGFLSTLVSLGDTLYVEVVCSIPRGCIQTGFAAISRGELLQNSPFEEFLPLDPFVY